MATTITPTIVTETVTITRAPSVSQLQQSGAAVSGGGTTLTAGTYQYCGTLSAVEALLAAPVAITSLAWAANVVTATVTAVGVSSGETFLVTIAGVTPAGYNGTFVATATGATTFTYPLAVNPGSETVPGTYTPPYVAFLQNAATTFFAQGSSVGMYLLELGTETTATAAITALETWITNNPNVFYAYLVAPSWDGSALGTMTNTYAGPSAKTYFFPTTTSGNISNYAGNKAVIATVPSPSAAATEFQAAYWFYQWLANNPSSATPAAPMAYRYAYGVTPWPSTGQTANINAILTAYGNVILTGAEGGISTATGFKGTTMDGQQAMFWYAVDWFQIQAKRQMAAAIINGSNINPPLGYNQPGVNSLLAVGNNVCTSGISFGLALTASMTATPFATYVAQNPSDYDAGIYNGFALTVTPQLGFLGITVAIDALQFVA